MSFITIWTLINFILLGVGICISFCFINKSITNIYQKTNKKLY